MINEHIRLRKSMAWYYHILFIALIFVGGILFAMSQTDWQADYFDTGIGFAVFYVIIVFVWRGIALQNAWSEMVVEGYPNVYVWHGLHHHLFGIILKEEDNAIIVGKIRFHFFPRWDAIIGKYRISKTELVKHGNHWSIATDLSTVNAVNNPLIEENH